MSKDTSEEVTGAATLSAVTGVPFETSLTELETVVRDLESGDLPLERAIQLFERGMTLSQQCRRQLEEAETRVEVLVKRGSQVKPESMPGK